MHVTQHATTFAGLLVRLSEERGGVCACGCNAYCVHVCTYMILNPQRKRVERHNESTSALSMATRMRIVKHTHTHIHARARARVHTCIVCVPGENRPRSKACPWYIEPITISDNLFRKQWKRMPHYEWMNIQGLSNDWVLVTDNYFMFDCSRHE